MQTAAHGSEDPGTERAMGQEEDELAELLWRYVADLRNGTKAELDPASLQEPSKREQLAALAHLADQVHDLLEIGQQRSATESRARLIEAIRAGSDVSVQVRRASVGRTRGTARAVMLLLAITALLGAVAVLEWCDRSPTADSQPTRR